MFSFSRNSRSQIANWWWTVDKVLLTLITVLIIIGIIYFVVTFTMSKLLTVLERRLKSDD